MHYILLNFNDTTVERKQLEQLTKDENKKIAFLATYLQKIVNTFDDMDSYQMEQNERRE